MLERVDLYGPVHKGLRHAMNACLLKLGQLDPSDAADVSEGLCQLRDLLRWCEAHLEIEERFVHSAIDRKRPGALVGHVRNDHASHTREFELLRADAEALEQSCAAAPSVSHARARQLYLHFSRFVGENLEHMAFEETELNGLLWELFSADELRAILGTILASEPPEQLMRTVRWMVPALDPATRAGTIAAARGDIAPAVFQGLLGQLKPLLSERDHVKLMTALGERVAA